MLDISPETACTAMLHANWDSKELLGHSGPICVLPTAFDKGMEDY